MANLRLCRLDVRRRLGPAGKLGSVPPAVAGGSLYLTRRLPQAVLTSYRAHIKAAELPGCGGDFR